MATVKNVDRKLRPVPLAGGRTLAFGEEASGVDVTGKNEAAWIGAKSLIVVDASNPPQAPAPPLVEVLAAAGDWNDKDFYEPGLLVTDDGDLYLSLLAGINHPPVSSPEYWLSLGKADETGAAAAAQSAAEAAAAALVSTEAKTRGTADTALAASIAAETKTRETVDTANATAITSEATARAAAISTEATARGNADAALSAAITSEAVARSAGDTFVNLRAADFATEAGGKVIDFAALCKVMEETGKGAVIPSACEAKEPNVLCNKQNITGAVAKAAFQYRFYGLGARSTIKAVLTEGQAAFRFNQDASGVNVDTALYNHPDVTFENITCEGTGAGTFATTYNRSFRLVNIQCKNLTAGFKNKGFSDLTYIDTFTGDSSVTGFGWEGENGDGQRISNVQFYGGRGILSKHGSGTCTGLVSGEHKFIASKWIILDEHLEGDGPNTAGGKAQNPVIKLEGGDYLVKGCRLSTLTNPNRAAIEVNDSGQAERFTLLTFENTRFMQRLDNPANPTKVAEPIGNLQGVALNLVALSPKSVIKFIDTHAEIYQQTSEASQFDVRARVGMKITAPGVEASQVALQEQLTNRRVMLSSSDCVIRFNSSTESPEVRPVGGNVDLITTHRFATPAINLTKFASGSEEAKSAPTTRAAGTHYYRMWAIDDRGHKTNLSTEKSITVAEGEVPTVSFIAGYACRVILEHGTEAGKFTDWVEIILPLGQATIADMGSAIAGQAWSSTGLPTAPGTAVSENSTVAGYVVLDPAARPFDESLKFSKLLLMSAVPTYKAPGESGTENRQAVAESAPRNLATSSMTLTSGVPAVAAIVVPGRTLISGVGFGVVTVEGTAANRTHLFIAILNAEKSVIRRSVDYSSATNNAMPTSTFRALLATATYETGESPELLYALVCETMSSTNPITILCREAGNAFQFGAAPLLAGTGPAAQSTPEALAEKPAVAESSKLPYLYFV